MSNRVKYYFVYHRLTNSTRNIAVDSSHYCHDRRYSNFAEISISIILRDTDEHKLYQRYSVR
jgi:hypothetical protein